MDICSLNENKFAKVAKMRPKDLAMFHQQYFSRVYPSGKEYHAIRNTMRYGIPCYTKYYAIRNTIRMLYRGFVSLCSLIGTRVMSSNFNPMNCWLYGSQMAALNFQALGLATLVNLGRFMENGSVGYVLKPPILRNTTEPFEPNSPNIYALRAAQESPMEVTIQVSVNSLRVMQFICCITISAFITLNSVWVVF